MSCRGGNGWNSIGSSSSSLSSSLSLSPSLSLSLSSSTREYFPPLLSDLHNQERPSILHITIIYLSSSNLSSSYLSSLYIYHHCQENGIPLTIINNHPSRLLAISIIFLNYMMEDLVIEWMWFDAIYEICGGEVARFFF